MKLMGRKYYWFALVAVLFVLVVLLFTNSQKIGMLGNGYTGETDGERRHLHFAIIKGHQIDFRGYVQNENKLNSWANPIDFIKNNREV
jgi:hypothetical protein